MTITSKARPSRPAQRVSALSEAAATTAPTVLLTVAPSEASAPASVSWIMIARPGTFRGHSAGLFTLDAATFAQMIANHHDVDGGRVPVDHEHASEQLATEGSIPTLGAPAQGWVTDLEVRSDGCLWGKVEWSEQARDYIRSNAYRYVSPAVRFGSKHPVTGKPIGARLSSVALTNQPFLGRGDRPGSEGLAPITAKDTNATPRRGARKNKLENGSEVATLRAEIERLTSELSSAKKETAREKKRRRQAEQRIADLDAANAEREEQEIAARVDDAIMTRKLTLDRGALIALCKSNRDAFDAAYPPVPVHQRHLLTLLATGPNSDPMPRTAVIEDDGPKQQKDAETEAAALIVQAKDKGVTMSRDEAFSIVVGRLQREKRQAGGMP